MKYTFNQINSTTYEVVWVQQQNTRTLILTSPEDDALIADLQNSENLGKFVDVLIDNTNPNSDNTPSNYNTGKTNYIDNMSKYDKLKVESTILAFNSASYANQTGTLTLKSIGGDLLTVTGFSTGSGGSLFPFTGSAIISGSLGVTGSTSIRGTFNQGSSSLASGLFSHVQGFANTASGIYSHAEGQLTKATGSYSHAEGYSTIARGLNSHAEGNGTQAIGDYSHAEGQFTSTTGNYSHAEGLYTSTTGNYSHAEGLFTSTTGEMSHAEGVQTLAQGVGSHAEGGWHYYDLEGEVILPGGTATGNASHAEGLSTLASGEGAHAEGYYTVALGNYQHVQGQCNISSPAQSAFIIGNGIDTFNRSNLVFASGTEFQITGSLRVSGSTHITGSLKVSGGITGSFSGSIAAPGSVNKIIYNNAGVLGGAANVEITTAGNLLLVATTDPATPSAGTLEMYAKTIAGKVVPKVKGPSGLDYVLQPALFQNSNYLWTMTGGAAGLWLNTAGFGIGTFAATNPTPAGTLYTAQKRSRYSNVVTTTNQVLGQRNADAVFFRGASANLGGFFFYTRCGFDTWTNGGRFFAGMATATTVISADPSALNNTVGFCVDVADNGLISFLTRGTAATKQSTGLTIATGKGYDIFIFNAPNSGTFTYRIVDLITAAEFSGTATLNPPAASTLLTANVLASNAAVTPVNSIQLGISKIYIETDY